MIAGCSVVGGAGNFVAVAVAGAGGAEGSVAQGVNCPMVGGAGHSVAGDAENFGGASLVGLPITIPASLCSSSFLPMGQCGPHEHFSVACLGITMALGDCSYFGLFFCFDGGVGVETGGGGIGQSLLVLNRFSEADPALGQGYPV